MTAKTLALISGKGGSGKTTLGLTLASLLSSCNIKVLLVDCDLSTNGATYFYEKKLTDKKENLTCFSEILYNEDNNKYNFLKINSYYEFIPSIVSADNKHSKNGYINTALFEKFFQKVSSKYEIIIFDCQAGYSEVLKNLLPVVELNLAVMEADAISSSAMRSLYLKIGKHLNDKKIFQVFNKATNEEYEIYSKLYGGTIFTNIETVMFDWKIRKSFSIAQIPDIENTSANYGMQLLNICNALFPETSIQNKLDKFSTILKINDHSEKINYLREKISDMDKEQSTKKKNVFRKLYYPILFLSMLALLLLISLLFLKESIFNDLTSSLLVVFSVLISVFAILLPLLSFFDSYREQKNYRTELWSYRNELQHHIEEKERLTNKLSTLKKKRKSETNSGQQ